MTWQPKPDKQGGGEECDDNGGIEGGNGEIHGGAWANVRDGQERATRICPWGK